MSGEMFLKLGCCRGEARPPFTTHSRCPLVRQHLQRSRQDGGRRGAAASQAVGPAVLLMFSSVGGAARQPAHEQPCRSADTVNTCGQNMWSAQRFCRTMTNRLWDGGARRGGVCVVPPPGLFVCSSASFCHVCVHPSLFQNFC